MADLTTLRRSPLHHLHDRLREAAVSGDRGAGLREVPFLTMVSVRATPGSAACGRVAEVLGAPLPESCGAVSISGPHAALWLGPDEWLVVSTAEAGPLSEALTEALGGDPGAVVDMSANRTTLELSGPSARLALEKGTPVDLHPRSFGPGQAVTTTLGPVPLLLWQTDAATYRLLPRSSFADYVARWLLDALTEYASPEVP
jgi:heterotetrameric sarcosine oxidase gamma subunit